ncbi:MAG: winged helix-turn-helix domain-containing protein [Propionibacteriaceae bacterium]
MNETSDPSYVGLQLDAAALRVLAHPLRSRLLSRLRVDGPATATALADTLNTNTGATSYHLRKLESVGLVADTGEGEGKRRLWRAATTFHSWNTSDFRHDEDAAAAVGWLERDYIRQLGLKAEQWQDASAGWPDEWVDPLGLNDSYVNVTPDQLRELNADLDALMERYRHVGDGDPRARRIQVYAYTHPSDLRFDGPDGDDAGAES